MRIKRLFILFLAPLLFCLAACRSAAPAAPAETQTHETQATETQTQATAEQTLPDGPAGKEEEMIYAQIGESTLRIRSADNSSAEAFLALLREGDLTVSMRDYGGFEKVGALETPLPTNDARITAAPGDVILYNGDRITIYYGKNTWSLTRLGRVEGVTPEALRTALGDGDPTVVFSLREAAE